MTALVLTLFALQAPLDEGTFLIRQDTAEIGREAFRLAAARGGAGWTLASTVRYDRSRPIVVLNPILEIGADSLPASLEFSVADPREPLRILGQLSRLRRPSWCSTTRSSCCTSSLRGGPPRVPYR